MDSYHNQKSLQMLLIPILIVIVLLIIISYVYETDVTSRCTQVLGNGQPDNINILFMADNYETLLEFKSDVNYYIDRSGLHNGILSVEPFKSRWSKFNFFSFDEIHDLDCLTGKDYLLCDQNKIKSLASECKHDYIIVLSKHGIFDSRESLRSSAYLNVATINTADNRFVFAHEFGHIFGGLADEYITGEEIDDAPNCDILTCPKWYGLFDGVGCFQGCTTASLYRSTENSIMRDYTETNSFGPVNENVLRGFL